MISTPFRTTYRFYISSLIALMLGRLRMEIDEAIQKYTELVSTTFVPSQDSAVDGGAQYDTELLEAKLKEMIADTGGSDTTALLTEDPSHCRVCVLLLNLRHKNRLTKVLDSSVLVILAI